ncbi:MAG TPA: phospho-N-acetylmuramoyl-pentapeptide-transferase [Planctomycetota bacterium]|nr:phospho-N-acetylmuramoyl-pentapeptide-transferase [Planctomycetota bacterium]
MLYLLRHLEDWFGPFRLFGYWSFRSMGAVVTALAVSLLLGPLVIRLLRRHGARDQGRTFGGLNVASKEGTPTMGGLLLLASLFTASLLWCDLSNQQVRIVLAAALYFGSIGAFDDILKIRHHSNERGLARHWKYTAQIAFGLLVGVLFLTAPSSPYDHQVAHTLVLPLWSKGIYLGAGYLLFVVVFMVLASNSVNLTDGLDGLAIVPAMLVAAVLGVFAFVVGNPDPEMAQRLLFRPLPGCDELVVFVSAFLGAGAGFLWFNCHPASVFMGDTGSLALGGILGTLALLVKQELVFFIAGGIFVVEAGSSFIQDYIGLKLLGRRIFFRAPYHHSLMHQGYGETKVTVRFWILSAIFAVMALATLKVR